MKCGTCLKAVLARIGFKRTSDCGCEDMAKELDRLTSKQLIAQREMILDELQSRAAKYRYTFNRMAAGAILDACTVAHKNHRE